MSEPILISRAKAFATGRLAVLDRGFEYWCTTDGPRSPRFEKVPLCAPLVSPSMRYAIDLTRADEHDLSDVVELDTGRVIGTVSKSGFHYVWLDDETLAVEGNGSVGVLDARGVTVHDVVGAGSMRVSRESRRIACQRRGGVVVLDLGSEITEREIRRGEPLAVMPDGRIAIRERSGECHLYDASSGNEEPLGVCGAMAIDARGRLIASVRIGDHSRIAMRRENRWVPISNGPDDRAPTPHPEWHWIAFERHDGTSSEVWVSAHDVEWKVASGTWPRWREYLDTLTTPMSSLRSHGAARRRRIAAGYAPPTWSTSTRLREPDELNSAPRLDRESVRSLLAQIVAAEALAEWASDAPMNARTDATVEAAARVDAARIALETATRADLEALRSDGDVAIAKRATDTLRERELMERSMRTVRE